MANNFQIPHCCYSIYSLKINNYSVFVAHFKSSSRGFKPVNFVIPFSKIRQKPIASNGPLSQPVVMLNISFELKFIEKYFVDFLTKINLNTLLPNKKSNLTIKTLHKFKITHQ